MRIAVAPRLPRPVAAPPICLQSLAGAPTLAGTDRRDASAGQSVCYGRTLADQAPIPHEFCSDTTNAHQFPSCRSHPLSLDIGADCVLTVSIRNLDSNAVRQIRLDPER
jgi:hypothetical protein